MYIQLNTPLGRVVVSADLIVPHPMVGQLLISCPGCDELKPIGSFGFRTMPDGCIRNQSYCGHCRSSAAATQS